jgi:hypothetical protein
MKRDCSDMTKLPSIIVDIPVLTGTAAFGQWFSGFYPADDRGGGIDLYQSGE